MQIEDLLYILTQQTNQQTTAINQHAAEAITQHATSSYEIIQRLDEIIYLLQNTLYGIGIILQLSHLTLSLLQLAAVLILVYMLSKSIYLNLVQVWF